MAKYIVGINLPLKAKAHESGVTLIDMAGNILFSANEERFSRVKLDGDFPEKSIEMMFAHTGVKPEEIAYVAIPTIPDWQKIGRFLEFLWSEKKADFLRPGLYKELFALVKREKQVVKLVNSEFDGFKMKYFWPDFIKKNFPKAEIVKVDHHMAHAAGAYYTSPWADSIILTVDGAGNYLTSLVASGQDGRIKVIDKTFVPNSLGSFWGSITRVCGFKSGTRHGGKVTGLAARGDYRVLIDKFRLLVRPQGMRIKTQSEYFFDTKKFIPDWNSYEPERLKAFIGEATREDIAAAAQYRLEEVVLEIVRNIKKAYPSDKIVLAGGVFANVLLNQKILELPEIADVYIFPAMSDCGLACGAALKLLADVKKQSGDKLLPQRLRDVYLGPLYKDEEIVASLNRHKLKYRKMAEPASEIAKLIFDNKIVAFYAGRMEFGPRALGSRSIIYAPIDPTANDWLNKKLNRSEFMPFAPVTMIEHVKECYLGIADDPVAARFMTITYHCTDLMKKQAPACVHVDGTARPQVLKRDDNPYYYDILNEYYKLSGIPTLINTSFNMHEEPIVASPDDAIRAFLDSGVDYLVMEGYIMGIEDNWHLTAAKSYS